MILTIGDWIFNTIHESWYEVHAIYGEAFSANRIDNQNQVTPGREKFESTDAFLRAGQSHVCHTCKEMYTLGWEGNTGPWRHVCPQATKIEPAHYGGKDNVYEVIKVIAAWFPEGVVMFCLGNTIKYVSRHGKKTGESALDDLKKARWYLDWVIEHLEKKNG